MIVTTLQHTPTWVFGLFVALVALGLSMSFPRTVSLRRSLMLPLALLGLSLLGVGVGVALATRPELRQSTSLAVVASAAYGLFSGVFLSRALALWTIARQAPAPQHA